MNYTPPFKITPEILNLSQEIFRKIGFLTASRLDVAPVRLRKSNEIKTIHASLSIEGNTLSLDQVTDVFEGKRVLGPKKDICEVKNAIQVYAHLSSFNPFSVNGFLEAHRLLLSGLVERAGGWRKSGVGIFNKGEVIHVPPKADRVPYLMEDLFNFLNQEDQLSWLLKGCIFHYELEFIHPFEDGNGRMGRLWQQRVLMKEDPLFEFISVEEIIRKNQKQYYEVLRGCDLAGESTEFIAFSLKQIHEALKVYENLSVPTFKDSQSRLSYASYKFSSKSFSRKDYLDLHRDISTATASRDLTEGLKANLLEKKGEKNQTVYFFKT